MTIRGVWGEDASLAALGEGASFSKLAIARKEKLRPNAASLGERPEALQNL